MTRAWRSVFWNVVLMLVMLVFAGITTSIAFEGRSHFVIGLFGAMAVAFWVGAARSLFLGVFAKAQGMVMRGPTHTTTIPWGEVEEITLGALAGSPAGAAGAVAPIVMQRRPDGKVKRVELNIIGGYGLSPQRPTPAEQAVAGLRECWDDWRRRQPASGQNKNAMG